MDVLHVELVFAEVMLMRLRGKNPEAGTSIF